VGAPAHAVRRLLDRARHRYAEAKKQAAERWADDRIAYTAAKTASILEILDSASRRATETGWGY
jgi:GrpB-like predicted nucleotidyltransferase (UPF0157 family)